MIPEKGRKFVADLLNEGHPGVTTMKALACSYVWWLGIDDNLEKAVKECSQCQMTRHSCSSATSSLSHLFLGNICMLITLGLFSVICFQSSWMLSRNGWKWLKYHQQLLTSQ